MSLAAVPVPADEVLRALGNPTRLVCDSRRLRRGDAFAAFPGGRTDGRSFIPQALAQGAAGVLWEPAGFRWQVDWRVANAAVPDLARRLGEFADRVFGHPSGALRVIGVTGTNGKTSCTHWIAQAFAALGWRAAVLGTLGNGLVGDAEPELQPALNTTLDAARLQETLAELRSAGASVVAMEVSSHGLDQRRVDGTEFAVALFTNLSRDHLDYHGSMEAYAEAKARLFDWPTLSAAVINADDKFGETLAQRAAARGCRVIRYGLAGAEVGAHAVRHHAGGVAFEVRTPWGEARVEAPVSGTFNVSNLLGVLAVLCASGVPLADAVRALAGIRAPAGRMQRLGGDGRPTVVVDYAHSPDALAKVLAALRPSLPAGGRLVCVFGCGGERDRGKRPEMGRIAEAAADRVILTSDNPRGEVAQAILADIVAGLRDPAAVRVEPDRALAVAQAIGEAGVADIVLLAGKGHERFQEIGGLRLPFSDAEHAEAALAAWRPS